MKTLFLSFTCEDVGVAMVTNMISQLLSLFLLYNFISHRSFPRYLRVAIKQNPSRHEDNLMPILDLKVWIDRKNVIMNGEDCTVNVVLHEFYAKEVSSKMMLSSRSALPMKVKKKTLYLSFITFL